MGKVVYIPREYDYSVAVKMFAKFASQVMNNRERFADEEWQALVRLYDSFLSAEEYNSGVEEPTEEKKESKPAVVYNMCKDHPRYGAKRAPSHDCKVCWSKFKEFNPDIYAKKRKDWERKHGGTA